MVRFLFDLGVGDTGDRYGPTPVDTMDESAAASLFAAVLRGVPHLPEDDFAWEDEMPK